MSEQVPRLPNTYLLLHAEHLERRLAHDGRDLRLLRRVQLPVVQLGTHRRIRVVALGKVQRRHNVDGECVELGEQLALLRVDLRIIKFTVLARGSRVQIHRMCVQVESVLLLLGTLGCFVALGAADDAATDGTSCGCS